MCCLFAINMLCVRPEPLTVPLCGDTRRALPTVLVQIPPFAVFILMLVVPGGCGAVAFATYTQFSRWTPPEK